MHVWEILAASNPPGTAGRALLSTSSWLRLREALGLSQRELQVVQAVFEDQKEESIAFELGISPHTVNTYFQRVYRKLNVGSRSQLIVRIMAEHLALPANGSGASGQPPVSSET